MTFINYNGLNFNLLKNNFINLGNDVKANDHDLADGLTKDEIEKIDSNKDGILTEKEYKSAYDADPETQQKYWAAYQAYFNIENKIENATKVNIQNINNQTVKTYLKDDKVVNYSSTITDGSQHRTTTTQYDGTSVTLDRAYRICALTVDDNVIDFGTETIDSFTSFTLNGKEYKHGVNCVIKDNNGIISVQDDNGKYLFVSNTKENIFRTFNNNQVETELTFNNNELIRKTTDKTTFNYTSGIVIVDNTTSNLSLIEFINRAYGNGEQAPTIGNTQNTPSTENSTTPETGNTTTPETENTTSTEPRKDIVESKTNENGSITTNYEDDDISILSVDGSEVVRNKDNKIENYSIKNSDGSVINTNFTYTTTGNIYSININGTEYTSGQDCNIYKDENGNTIVKDNKGKELLTIEKVANSNETILTHYKNGEKVTALCIDNKNFSPKYKNEYFEGKLYTKQNCNNLNDKKHYFYKATHSMTNIDGSTCITYEDESYKNIAKDNSIATSDKNNNLTQYSFADIDGTKYETSLSWNESKELTSVTINGKEYKNITKTDDGSILIKDDKENTVLKIRTEKIDDTHKETIFYHYENNKPVAGLRLDNGNIPIAKYEYDKKGNLKAKMYCAAGEVNLKDYLPETNNVNSIVDKNGNIVELSYLDADGKEYKTKFEYNQQTNEIASITINDVVYIDGQDCDIYDININGDIGIKDKNGNIVFTMEKTSNGDTIIYHHNEKGIRTSAVRFDEAGCPIGKYDYDANGTTTTKLYLHTDKNTTESELISYDTKGMTKSEIKTGTHTIKNETTGLVEKEQTFDDNGKLTQEKVYNYDENGKVKDSITTNYEYTKEKVTETIYETDNTTKKTDYNEEKRNVTGTVNATYNQQTGLVEKEQTFDINGKLTQEKVYEYDANGKVTNTITTNYEKETGKVTKTVKTNYDTEKGNVTGSQSTIYNPETGLVEKEQTHDANGKLTQDRVYNYDENGNITGSVQNNYNTETGEAASKTTYDKDGKVINTSTYKYSKTSNGLIRQECDIVDAQGNVTGKIVNFCYSDGDVLESREYNSNGEMIARERLFVNTKTDTLHKKTKVEFEPNSEFIIPKAIVETDGNEKQTDLTIMEFILNAYGISGDKALSIAAKILAANENINENTIITNEILNELNFTFKVTWKGEIVENK